MATPKKIILLACGSFNPPTHMHLRIFEIARDYLHRMGKYQVVAGLMSPVHDSYGKKDLASSSDRCEMVRRSLQNSDWIHLSDWECHQTGWTPTRQVLHQHQELVDSIVNGNLDSSTKRQRTEELAWARDLGSEQLHMKLLCGGDLLESFGKPGLWKDDDIETIVGSYGLVVITREGSNPLRFIYESDVLTRLQRNIDLVTEWIANEVSSSRIRRALGRCESVKYLLPDPVITYVHQRALYGASSEYVRPLSLLLVPGMPPSFLTPSPCDVDMTYCERPVLTLTAPDASSTTAAGDLSPPACRTAPSPPRPTPQPRQESGRCRTWRRGVEKKPGSSRRVRPEPAAKVSCGDSGSEGDTDRGSETPSPPQQQQQVEAPDGPGCQPSDPDQGDGYRSDRDCGLSLVAGSDQEGEVGRDGDPLPPESDTVGRQNGDNDPPGRDVTERRGSWEDDLKDRPPAEPPCGDTPAGRGDCDPQSDPDTAVGPPGSPPAPVVDTTAGGDDRSPPPVIGVNGPDRESDRIDNHRPPPSSPERRDTPDHDRPSESTAGISTGHTGDEVDQDGTPPPPEPPPPVPGSSPAQVYCGRYGDRPQLPSITITEHGDCGGTDRADPPSPEPPGPDAADGDRIRIELRQDGVTVVSGRETQL